MYDTIVEVTWDDYGETTHTLGWLMESEGRCLCLAMEYTDSGPHTVKIPVGLIISLKVI